MVLAELGQKLTGALKKLNQVTVVDDKVLGEILTDIASALLSADVNIKWVQRLRDQVKATVAAHMSQDGQGDGINIRKLIQRTVVEQLTAMLDSDNPPY
jgi:signal recognition particle subunit SRP54